MACWVWGSKGSPSPLHGLDALGFEQGTQLAVDGGDALHPGAVLGVLGNVLDGQVEVVGEVEHADEQTVAGDPGRLGPLLLTSAA